MGDRSQPSIRPVPGPRDSEPLDPGHYEFYEVGGHGALGLFWVEPGFGAQEVARFAPERLPQLVRAAVDWICRPLEVEP